MARFLTPRSLQYTWQVLSWINYIALEYLVSCDRLFEHQSLVVEHVFQENLFSSNSHLEAGEHARTDDKVKRWKKRKMNKNFISRGTTRKCNHCWKGMSKRVRVLTRLYRISQTARDQ